MQKLSKSVGYYSVLLHIDARTLSQSQYINNIYAESQASSNLAVKTGALFHKQACAKSTVRL